MPLSKCPRCEKLFDKVSNSICPSCIGDEEKDFELIRSTIEENPDINSQGVAELTGIDVKCVLRMMDSGQISVSAPGELEKVVCGRCGAPAISATKRLCEPCLTKLEKEVIQTQTKISLNEKKKVEVDSYNVRDSLQGKRR